MKSKVAPFKFKPFSNKQLKVLTWWMDNSPVKDKDIIIADGSVRAGKTVVMSLGFVMWAISSFDGENFALCGKTIGSLRRNVVKPLLRMLKSRGYKYKEHRADNYITIAKGNISNDFYLFGGKDESSQDLIQGITLAGILFDEVALMPQSFVNQATARCSVEGAKMWFNCNPEGPYHWFKTEYLDNLEHKNAMQLHFTMDDNLSLSDKVKQRYTRMYSGLFYDRYIKGLWVMADGVIYPEFSEEKHCINIRDIPPDNLRYFILCDYGITNPHVYLKVAFRLYSGTPHLFVIDEYYNKGEGQKPKTDNLFLEDYKKFTKEIHEESIIIDPSATSLINLLRQDAISVREANNSVMDGISNVTTWLKEERIHIVKDNCPNLIKEFNSYIWDAKAQQRGLDAPSKENDHALDALRYGINTVYPLAQADLSFLKGGSIWG